MNSHQRILISGSGIAGLTLAYWLEQFGFKPAIIEKRPDLSDAGYMIDFYGSGFDVAERMGLLEPLHAKHYPIAKLELVDKHGKAQATLSVERFRAMLKYRHFNFLRGDLVDVLHRHVKDAVPIRFCTSVTRIEPRPDNVSVEYADGTFESVDLLIGADGFHSHTRELLWGDETKFKKFLGFYIACGIIDDFLSSGAAYVSRLAPNRQASFYAIGDNRLATFFAFKSEQRKRMMRQQQVDLLREEFSSVGWIVPRLVEATGASQQFYFDEVAQIRLTPWYQERVALVGDACQCLTLLAGQGASMAMAGAYLLAEALRDAHGDYRIAYPAYQAKLLPEIEKRQSRARNLAKTFVPPNQLAVWMTYLLLKAAYLPGFRSLFAREIGAGSIIH